MEQPPSGAFSWTEPGKTSADEYAGGSLRQRRNAADADNSHARLLCVVEAEIIPRLMLAGVGRPTATTATTAAPRAITGADVLMLANIVLDQDAARAIAHVRALQAAGADPTSLCLDLLAPAARHLGTLWEDDTADFTAVTVALGRLQQVLRDLAPDLDGEPMPAGHRPDGAGRRALLVPTPGEQHSFGLIMVSEFFRRAGWDVSGGPLDSSRELLDWVAAEPFDLVGLSLSHEHLLPSLAADIRAVRAVQRNPAMAVMVGGRVFQQQPELAREIGADATAGDGLDAVATACQLVALRERKG